VGYLAKLFNCTERYVQKLAGDDIIPRAEKGKYDLILCVQNYTQHLRDQAIGKGGGSGNVNTENARLKKAQVEHKEFQVEIIKGDWIPRDEVRDLVTSIAVIYGSSLDALGGRQANELAGIDNPAEIRRQLFGECRQIREDTAGKLLQYASELSDRGREFS
jgi:hypothetical protein